jgi:hypothetical protein
VPLCRKLRHCRRPAGRRGSAGAGIGRAAGGHSAASANVTAVGREQSITNEAIRRLLLEHGVDPTFEVESEDGLEIGGASVHAAGLARFVHPGLAKRGVINAPPAIAAPGQT